MSTHTARVEELRQAIASSPCKWREEIGNSDHPVGASRLLRNNTRALVLGHTNGSWSGGIGENILTSGTSANEVVAFIDRYEQELP